MLESLTSGILWSRWRGKRSRHSRRMRNPQFCVSGRQPIQQWIELIQFRSRWSCFWSVSLYASCYNTFSANYTNHSHHQWNQIGYLAYHNRYEIHVLICHNQIWKFHSDVIYETSWSCGNIKPWCVRVCVRWEGLGWWGIGGGGCRNYCRFNAFVINHRSLFDSKYIFACWVIWK